MYHFPEGDAKWHECGSQRVRKLAQQVSASKSTKIRPMPRPITNGPGWSATPKAIFKKQSATRTVLLELTTSADGGEASFIDTLGQCYYAVGDYENAVKYERQAIAKVDHMQVMHRQLAMFEKALAEKQASSKDADRKPK